jgi:two-component system, OmpR family, response regulator PhoP
MRILLVEDEAPLRETLAARLKREGFAVDAAGDGEEGLYNGREVPFDMAIIDLGLPKMSGMDLVRALRSEGKKFPILILTARSSWQDKVEGLKSGADDYLVKPFQPEELVARLRAVCRRSAGTAGARLQLGDVEVDLTARGVWLQGQRVDVTAREWAVLEALVLRAGRIVPKADLERLVVGAEADVASNVLEVHVSGLRRKLGRELIETIRGLGYRVGGGT